MFLILLLDVGFFIASFCHLSETDTMLSLGIHAFTYEGFCEIRRKYPSVVSTDFDCKMALMLLNCTKLSIQ